MSSNTDEEPNSIFRKYLKFIIRYISYEISKIEKDTMILKYCIMDDSFGDIGKGSSWEFIKLDYKNNMIHFHSGKKDIYFEFPNLE